MKPTLMDVLLPYRCPIRPAVPLLAINVRRGDASAVARAPKGIDPEPVTAWLTAEVGTVPPLDFDPIPGGASNLTFTVTDGAGRRVVLRRPPTGHVLASAHDMNREHRVISALAPTSVPVPLALGLCTDPHVNGADFYVMDLRGGLGGVQPGPTPWPSTRRCAR